MDTMFNHEMARMKKVRKSTPKVRSGCITCKARRVKCDEQKPNCLRCVRANRHCEGYPDLAWSNGVQQLPLEPASITTYSIPFKVPGSQADRQLLHYYCSQAAWNLSSCADPTLWTELILQRASHQPVIRNALVALSSLHKDYLCGQMLDVNQELQPHPTGLSSIGNVKTMGMISRCHRQLRNYLSRPDASPDVALVCSVIFYTFESLLGESQRAIWHLDQGLILLRQCQLDKSFDPNDTLIPHLSRLLQHLDLQASCFDDRRRPVLQLATEAETKGHVSIVPDTFLDLCHVEAVLDKIQNWVLHHLVEYVHYRGASAEEMPHELLMERLIIAEQLQKFETVLNNFASYESPISQSRTRVRLEDHRQQRTQRTLLLRINLHTFLYLIRENIPQISADGEDAAETKLNILPGYNRRLFAQTAGPVDLGNAELNLESALGAMNALLAQAPSTLMASTPGTLPADLPRTYTLSTHLIAALYFLSLKTTNKQMVEKAIAFFSHPRLRHSRDGLWDAETTALLVENLVKIRQYGIVSEGNDGSDIVMHVSEHDRTVNVDELQRIFKMSERLGLPMMQSKRFTLVSETGQLTLDERNTVSLADSSAAHLYGGQYLYREWSADVYGQSGTLPARSGGSAQGKPRRKSPPNSREKSISHSALDDAKSTSLFCLKKSVQPSSASTYPANAHSAHDIALDRALHHGYPITAAVSVLPMPVQGTSCSDDFIHNPSHSPPETTFLFAQTRDDGAERWRRSSMVDLMGDDMVDLENFGWPRYELSEHMLPQEQSNHRQPLGVATG